MMVFKLLGLCIWLLVVPMGLGLLVRAIPDQKRIPDNLQTFCSTFVIGYIVMFVLLELIGIPVMLLSVYHGYSRFVILYVIALAGSTVMGYVLYTKKKLRKALSGQVVQNPDQASVSWLQKEPFDTWEERIFWVLFLLLVGFQLYMSFTRASFDGDDAYYVVQALTAQQTDTLYRIDPNRGVSMPLDARHALALFPIWEAFIGTLCGIHATIVAHSVVPLVLIPLTYLVYLQIGNELFKEKKQQLPMFMALMALWQLFGNVSIYTNETFFLTRTWQGKSFAGNFIIPAVFWIFLCLFQSKEFKGRTEAARQPSGKIMFWVLLAMLNLAAGASSSLAVLLSCALTAGLGFLLMVKERSFRCLVSAGLSCLPGGIYVMLYLLL